MFAARGGHLDICACLGDHGADHNATDTVASCFGPIWSRSYVFYYNHQEGMTALMLAAGGGHQDICAWLADRGAEGVSFSNSELSSML